MWNAAGNNAKLSSVIPSSIASMAAVKPRAVQGGRDGMPRFYSRSTGYVDDVSPMKGGGFLKGQATQTLLSDSSVQNIDKWETAMLRSSYPDADANPEEAAEAQKREARLTAGLKKFALVASAQQGKTMKLWNAAANDEITTENIGHLHPSEMPELAKLSPEAKIAAHHAHVTNAKHMVFHPMKWMNQQKAPAVAGRSKGARKGKMAAAVKGARMQSLWNAAANDDTQGVFGGNDDTTGFHPLKWLANQRDRTEMAALKGASSSGKGSSEGLSTLSAADESDHSGRVFSERANHGRNYEGSYDNDNSIGIKVDALMGRETMLADLSSLDSYEASTNTSQFVAELDRLINMATEAYGSLPTAANPVVRGIATEDQQMIIDYLDSVASVTTGVPRGNYNESAGFTMGAKATSLPALAYAAESQEGTKTLVAALERDVGGAFTRLQEKLTVEEATSNDEGTKTLFVLKALAEAKAAVAEILTNPAYARREAKMQGSVVE